MHSLVFWISCDSQTIRGLALVHKLRLAWYGCFQPKFPRPLSPRSRIRSHHDPFCTLSVYLSRVKHHFARSRTASRSKFPRIYTAPIVTREAIYEWVLSWHWNYVTCTLIFGALSRTQSYPMSPYGEFLAFAIHVARRCLLFLSLTHGRSQCLGGLITTIRIKWGKGRWDDSTYMKNDARGAEWFHLCGY